MNLAGALSSSQGYVRVGRSLPLFRLSTLSERVWTFEDGFPRRLLGTGAQGRSGARRNAKKELCFWCFAESHRCERAATVPASRFSWVHDTSFVLSFQRWPGQSEPIEIGRCLAKNKHWRGPCKPRKVAMSSGLYCTVTVQ